MLAAQTLIGMLAMDCAHHSTRLTSPVFEKVLRVPGQHFGERRLKGERLDGFDREGGRHVAGGS